MNCKSPLIFQINQLDEGDNCFDAKSSPEDLGLNEYSFLSPILYSLVLKLVKKRVDASFTLETSVEMECARCGDIFSFPVKISGKITYLPVSERLEIGEDTDIGALDLEYYRERIDLRNAISDGFRLALPIAPLCVKDCKGLCQSCGANLNREQCKCPPKEANSPFLELRRLVDG